MNFFSVSHTVVLDTLEVDADPVANVLLGDVAELNTDFATVGSLVGFNHITKLPSLLLS
jgi:hypothetical protein